MQPKAQETQHRGDYEPARSCCRKGSCIHGCSITNSEPRFLLTHRIVKLAKGLMKRTASEQIPARTQGISMGIPEFSIRAKSRAKPPQATLKPYTSHILGRSEPPSCDPQAPGKRRQGPNSAKSKREVTSFPAIFPGIAMPAGMALPGSRAYSR